MKLVRACSVVFALVMAILVFAAPAQAAPQPTASTDEIDIAIVGYTPNIGDITVQLKITNKTDKDFGVIPHTPNSKRRHERALFKKGTLGQDAISESVKVPCGTEQYIIVEYKWGKDTKKPGVTSEAQKCQAAHKRDKEKGGPTTQQPSAAPSPTGELAKTGESSLYWAMRLGPGALALGGIFLFAGRRPRRARASG
jgi:hypothetical protein